MESIATQVARSKNADFSENTCTFIMPKNYKVRSGEFAIVDWQVYDEMIACLNLLVSENIMTSELRDRCRSVISKTEIGENLPNNMKCNNANTLLGVVVYDKENKVLICNNCKDIWIAPKYRCDCGSATLTETHESNREFARNYAQHHTPH